MKLTKSLMPEGASVQCKGFLFDLDGTLVDSLPAVERAWCNWADRFGLDHDEVLGFIHGKQAITSLRHFMVGKSEAEIAAEFTRTEQIEPRRPQASPRCRAVDLLNHLNKAGIPGYRHFRINAGGAGAPSCCGSACAGSVCYCRAGKEVSQSLTPICSARSCWVLRRVNVPLLRMRQPVLSGTAAGCHVIAVNAPADTPRLDEVDFALTSLEQISVTKQPNGNVVVVRNT